MLGTLAAGAQAAHADGPDRPAETKTSWYGWQTLVSDTGAIALWSLAAVADDAKYGSGSRQNYELASTALVVSGFATYVLGGPAVHVAHGRGNTAVGSLLLRVLVPVGGAIVGGLVAGATWQDSGEVPEALVGAVLGFGAGGATAMIVDAAVLARAPVKPAGGPGLQTAFVPSAGGGTLLVAGRF